VAIFGLLHPFKKNLNELSKVAQLVKNRLFWSPCLYRKSIRSLGNSTFSKLTLIKGGATEKESKLTTLCKLKVLINSAPSQMTACQLNIGVKYTAHI
jgi:hypothetical protein